MLLAALLISITGWGLAGIFAGKAAQKTSQVSLLFWGPIITLPLILLPLLVGISPNPSLELLLPAAGSAVVLFIAWAFYISALQRGETSPVVAIGSAYPLFALLIFLLAGSRSLEAGVILGVVVIALGLLGLQGIGQGGVSRSALGLGIGAALMWGFWGFFDWQALQAGSAWDLMFWTFLFSLCISLLFGAQLLWRRGPQALQIGKDGIFYRIAASLASVTGVLAFYWALEAGTEPTTTIAITATYPLVTMLIAVLLGQERFYAKRLVAVALIVAGVVFLHL